MPGPVGNGHGRPGIAGSEPYSGDQDKGTADYDALAREGVEGRPPEGVTPSTLWGRLGQIFGPAPNELSATGQGVLGTSNLPPTGFVPDPSTPTGVIYAHAGREEYDPDPGPTREIEGNIPALPRGMGADPPVLHHIVHHYTHTVAEGNAWWSTTRITVPTTGPILIAPANPKRVRVTIFNTDTTNFVDLLSGPGATASGSPMGFKLTGSVANGQPRIDLNHTRDIWAIADTAAVSVTVLAEFSERPSGGGGGEQ